jgi:RNA polymerase sigma-70 factor, ECF subfamily
VRSDAATGERDQGRELLALYDDAIGDVYGYLVRRCGSDVAAEELTSETFLAAVDQVRRGPVDSVTVAWLIGIARHKLVDHWRRLGREQRAFALVDTEEIVDRWDVTLDGIDAMTTLGALAPQHRSVLTLRYLDGLPVADVARHLDRTEGATEQLLMRAKHAFRVAHEHNPGEEA